MSYIRENLTDPLKLDNLNSTSTLVLKQPANWSQLFDQFINITENYTSRDPDNVVKCWYYDIEEIQTSNIPNKSKSLSVFDVNTCSLSKNFDDLEYLLKTRNMNFDIIAISETRVISQQLIFKKCDLESTFIEIINPRKSN